MNTKNNKTREGIVGVFDNKPIFRSKSLIRHKFLVFALLWLAVLGSIILGAEISVYYSIFLGCLILGLVILFVVAIWSTGMYYPDTLEPAFVVSPSGGKILQKGQTVKMLSWNVQFMASNKNNHFFYDKGTDTFPKESVNLQIIEEVAKIIIEENPDILLLQEVDLNSQRTHFVNQLKVLREKLPASYQFYSSTPYFRVNYLPMRSMLGRLEMHLCTLSKYPINNALRHALPSKLNVSFLEQQFQLKRAILETNFPIESGQTLTVLNTHFSAFSKGTDTLDKQAQIAQKLLLKTGQFGPSVLVGDFNALCSPRFYEDVYPMDRHLYSKDYSPLEPLIKNFKMFPSEIEIAGPDHAKWLTHMSTADPTRTPHIALDFFFLTDHLKFKTHSVRQKDTQHISDHFPLVCEIEIPQK
jgi:endonuclease/exonuclease/phosphatase family metal-dependent hydrolase